MQEVILCKLGELVLKGLNRQKFEDRLKNELAACFPEFSKYIGMCKFTSCAHIGEKGCKICEMTQKGVISKSRHDNYVLLYNEAKNIKEWALSQ